jgi:hypothetical protein
VGLFRRRQETLNEQLLREAGLDPAQSLGEPVASTEPRREPESDPEPPKQLYRPLAVDGVARVALGSTKWDAVAAVQAPALGGDRIEFTTLPDGDVIVSQESGDADLSPLADAIEQHVSPPYNATAVRQEGTLWGVGAKRIQVAEIAFPKGDRLQFSRNDDDREFRVDSEPSHEPAPPELERVGEAVGESFYVEASRIDGDFWEVKVSPL